MLSCFIESILGSLFGGPNTPKTATERKVHRVMVLLVIVFLVGLVVVSAW